MDKIAELIGYIFMIAGGILILCTVLVIGGSYLLEDRYKHKVKIVLEFAKWYMKK